jgi:hypothetical protein
MEAGIDAGFVLSICGFLSGVSSLITSLLVNRNVAHKTDILRLQEKIIETNRRLDILNNVVRLISV